jgi:hypothetical protein
MVFNRKFSLKGRRIGMKRWTLMLVMVTGVAMTGLFAQENSSPPQESPASGAMVTEMEASVPADGNFTQEQLDTALAPIALYPDSLLAQILMAATYPDQVLEAAAWSKEHPDLKGEKAVEAVQEKSWDPSVASLCAFPEVLEMLASKPEWVEELGEMFLADPDAVMDTVQNLRQKAKDAGSLKQEQKKLKVAEKTVEQQTVIEIQPADPEVIFIPFYDPFIVYGHWWHHSHPYFYNPHHHHFAELIAFSSAIVVGHILWSHWDWHHHDINIDVHYYNHYHPRHPLTGKRPVSWREQLRPKNPHLSSVKPRKQIRKEVQGVAKTDSKAQKRIEAQKRLEERGGVKLEKMQEQLKRNAQGIRQQIGAQKPSGKPAAKPKPQPSTKPMPRPTTKPQVKPSPKPAVRPSPKPAKRPMPKPRPPRTTKPVIRPKPAVHRPPVSPRPARPAVRPMPSARPAPHAAPAAMHR